MTPIASGLLSERSTERRKPRLRRVRAFLRALVITLVGLEGLIRLWGYSERHIYEPIYTSFGKTGDLAYIHKPNLRQARARGLAVINTDSLGLRTKTSGSQPGLKEEGEYRIAVVGDSVTFGEGIRRTEDTFCQVLEDTLNGRGGVTRVRVFNFGASAYSVREMALTLQYRMLETQPDLVVMAIIPADFNLSRTPAIDESGYLIDRRFSHLSAPGSMARRVLRSIHLAYVLRDIGSRWFFKPDDIAERLSRSEIPESYRHLVQFKETAEQRGLPYVIALLPGLRRNPWGALPSQMAHDRLAYLDLSFLSNEFAAQAYMASSFDRHPSPAVHRRIGEALADYVRGKHWPSLTPPGAGE